jgi:hypothetical protein
LIAGISKNYLALPLIYFLRLVKFYMLITPLQPHRNVLHDTEGQPGARGIIGIETAGRNAQLAARMSPEERLHWAMEDVLKIFPEMSSNFEGGTSVVWDQEPWSLGCAAYYAPGEMQKPERVVIAQMRCSGHKMLLSQQGKRFEASIKTCGPSSPRQADF